MNDREHRLRQRIDTLTDERDKALERIDTLTDERDKALEREQRQRRRATAWKNRAYAVTKQLALAKARLQRK